MGQVGTSPPPPPSFLSGGSSNSPQNITTLRILHYVNIGLYTGRPEKKPKKHLAKAQIDMGLFFLDAEILAGNQKISLPRQKKTRKLPLVKDGVGGIHPKTGPHYL